MIRKLRERQRCSSVMYIGTLHSWWIKVRQMHRNTCIHSTLTPTRFRHKVCLLHLCSSHTCTDNLFHPKSYYSLHQERTHSSPSLIYIICHFTCQMLNPRLHSLSFTFNFQQNCCLGSRRPTKRSCFFCDELHLRFLSS